MTAACSLFTNLSDLDAPPSATDAGAIDPDATIVDAPGDQAAEVSLLDPDGGCPDGGFCDDFEEGLLGARWGASEIQGGTARLEDGGAGTGSRVFRSTTGAGVLPRPKTAFLVRPVLPPPKALRCTFAMRPEQAPKDGGQSWIDVFQFIGAGPGVARYELKLGMLDVESGVRVDVTLDDAGCLCPRTFAPIPKAFEVGTWVKVVFETNFQSILVSYDGAIVLNAAFDVGFVPESVNLALGLEDYATSGADVSYDDFACSFTY